MSRRSTRWSRLAWGLLVAGWAARAWAGSLQKSDIRRAIETPQTLKNVRIRLSWGHTEAIEIAGDGTVSHGRRPASRYTPSAPLTLRRLGRKLPVATVARIVGLFAADGLLRSGRKLRWPNSSHYRLRLTVPGAGQFECPHPDLRGPDWVAQRWHDKQDPLVARIIQTIREAVSQLEEQIRIAAGRLLSREALLLWLDDAVENVWLEYDVGHFTGDTHLRLAESGQLTGFEARWVANVGREKLRVSTTVPPREAREILRAAVQGSLLEMTPRRRIGIMDEARCSICLTARLSGVTYEHAVELWGGEVRTTPAFTKTAGALWAIVARCRKEAAAEDGPEGTVRRLLLAMLEEDAEKVGELILPHPDAARLTQPRPIGPELHERLKKAYAALPLRRVARGETVRLPNGAALKVGQEHVNDNSLVIASQRPVRDLPVRVVRQEGRWRVDAGPLIEARQPPARRRRRAGKR